VVAMLDLKRRQQLLADIFQGDPLREKGKANGKRQTAKVKSAARATVQRRIKTSPTLIITVKARFVNRNTFDFCLLPFDF